MGPHLGSRYTYHVENLRLMPDPAGLRLKEQKQQGVELILIST